MKKLIMLIACVLLGLLQAFAQNITEYGKPDELKGVTKVYISLVFAGSFLISLIIRSRSFNSTG